MEARDAKSVCSARWGWWGAIGPVRCLTLSNSTFRIISTIVSITVRPQSQSYWLSYSM